MNVLCFESSPNKTKHTVNLYPFVIWSVLNLLAFSIRSCHASCRSYRLPPRRDEVHRLDKSSQDWVVNHRGLSLDVIGNPGNCFFSIILEKPPGFLEKLRRAQTGKYWKMFALSLSLVFFLMVEPQPQRDSARQGTPKEFQILGSGPNGPIRLAISCHLTMSNHIQLILNRSFSSIYTYIYVHVCVRVCMCVCVHLFLYDVCV